MGRVGKNLNFGQFSSIYTIQAKTLSLCPEAHLPLLDQASVRPAKNGALEPEGSLQNSIRAVQGFFFF